ncbi:MAG: TetR/AcrR family transcriptional regulator [Anaerolineales bacterium]|jgi:AcrR family transcriptional regulator
MQTPSSQAVETTRDDILEAAHDLFVSQGYHGTSMRQIAAAAGVAVGGIYNHFENKEAIFQAVFAKYHPYHEIIPALEQAQGERLEDFVRDAATRMVTALASRPEFINLVFIEIVEFNSKHIGQIFQDVYPKIQKNLLRMAKDDPRLRPIPIPLLVRYFISLFFSYYIAEKILEGTPTPLAFRSGAMDKFVDIFLHGIIVEQPEA